MGVGYERHVLARHDGTAEAYISFDGPRTRSIVWGPHKYQSKEQAEAELNAVIERLRTARATTSKNRAAEVSDSSVNVIVVEEPPYRDASAALRLRDATPDEHASFIATISSNPE